MSYSFDEAIERRSYGSAKWGYYGADVLPMWVADMDFRSPPVVVAALHERIEHGCFGYDFDFSALSQTICERMARLYGWEVAPDQIVYLPSLVAGLNVVAQAVGAPGDGVLMQTPVYPPFLSAPVNQGRLVQPAQLALHTSAHTVSYSLDDDAMEAAITPQTKLFFLCNPHNPTGVTYQPAELARLAAICERHDIVICSDEIHCDLQLGGARHTPIATLSPEVAARTITLMAPSKTFNVPGLKCGFAIVPNPELCQRLKTVCDRIPLHINALGPVAALAAYRDGDPWLADLRAYLTDNRDLLVRYVAEQLPQLRTTVPDATYLAWLDCREAGIAGSPYSFFLNEAKVALNDGVPFGPGGEGFVRLNFGCPRPMLLEGLGRLKAALERQLAAS